MQYDAGEGQEVGRAPVTLLREAIGQSDFEAMQKDPVRFVRAFDRSPWGYQAETLRKVLAKRNDGKFIHRIAVVSWPRQDGKRTVSAWAGLVRLFCAEKHQTIITVALDRDSARIILNDARRIIQESPILFDLVDESWGLTKSSIRLKDGREWFIKSADGRFSRGQRPTCVLFDELGWSTDDGELFQVLSAGMGAAANPLMIITSTVGPIQAGPLWDLFERKDDSDILLLYTNENQSPLVTEEFLEGQRAILPPTIYTPASTITVGAQAAMFSARWKTTNARLPITTHLFLGTRVPVTPSSIWVGPETKQR